MVYCTWKNHVFGLCPKLASVIGPVIQHTVGASIILPEDGNKSSFRNVVFFRNIRRRTKFKNKILQVKLCYSFYLFKSIFSVS
jgi:hypothetical protein